MMVTKVGLARRVPASDSDVGAEGAGGSIQVEVGLGSCNTPDVIYLICNPTLAVSGAKLFYFCGFGFSSPCVVVFVMHLISCHHVHCICIRVHLMHSNIFPVSVLHSGAPFSSGGHFYLSFVCGD